MALLPNVKPFLAAMTHRRPRLLKTMSLSIMVFVAVLAMTGGCAYSYVDQHGIHHSIGLMKTSVDIDSEENPTAGAVVQVTTFGIAGYRTPLLSGLTIGYNRERVMSLKNNVVVTER